MELSDNSLSDEQADIVFVESTEAEKKTNIKERLKDPEYRRKLLSTLWVCLAFMTLGWIVGQRGPSFLDLQLITNVDIDKGSAYFTSGAVGYVCGSLVGGIILDLYSRKIIMFASIVIMGAVTAVVPWCHNYWLMIVLQTVIGLSSGVLDTGGNALTSRLWGNQVKHYMQAVHFSFAFGGVISPLVTKPFLATVLTNDTSSAGLSTDGVTSVYNTTTGTTQTAHVETASRIYIPFTISAALAFLTAIPLLHGYCSERNGRGKDVSSNVETSTSNNLPILPTFLKLVTLYLLGQMFMLYCSVEDVTAGYLVTFVVEQLNWSKQKGADLTSLFWGMFALGRFSGIFVVNLLHSVKMILICCTCIILSYIGLYLGSVYIIEELVWLFTGMLGASMSFVFPCIFTWTEEDIVSVSAKIASFFLIMSSIGMSLTPLLLGFLMEGYSSLYFIYVLFAISVLTALSFLILWLIVHFKIQPLVAAKRKSIVGG